MSRPYRCRRRAGPCRRQRPRPAAGASAACLAQVVGIACRAEDRIEGLGAKAEFGNVAFTDHNGAGNFFALDHAAIEVGHVVFMKRRAERGADAFRFVQILDGDGQAMKRAKPASGGQGFVRGGGLRQ